MNTTHKLVATSVLGITAAVLFAPSTTSAFGGRFGANLSEEVRQELRACRTKETRQEKRDCVRAVKEAHNLPMHKKHRYLNNVPEEAHEELKACHQEETRTEKRTCAKAVADKYNFELPKKHHRRGQYKRHRGRRLIQNLSEEDRTALRNALQSCRENNDSREDRRACRKEAISQYRNS